MIIKDKIKVMAIIFTVITLFSSTLAIIQGRTYDTHIHILMRFFITVIAIMSVVIYEKLSHKPMYIAHIVHYSITMGIIFITLWITGFFIELHPDAYRDIFLNYTIVWIVISVIWTIILRRITKNNKH